MPAASGPVTVYRLEQAKHAHDPFSGAGGLHVEGRWHPKGLRVSYAAGTSSLAILEKVTGSPREGLARVPFVLVEGRLDADEVVLVEAWAGLPAGWDAVPPPYGPAAQGIGVRFVREAIAVALSVPSAVNPHERNLVINPAHPRAASALAVVRKTPFALDPRWWRGL